eukprot:755671-Hanusia_phi.AAC.6
MHALVGKGSDEVHVECAADKQHSVGEDIRKLDYGVHIVSGTPDVAISEQDPGSRRSKNYTQRVKEEIIRANPTKKADEMLNQGFKEQIYDVYRYLPPQIQV